MKEIKKKKYLKILFIALAIILVVLGCCWNGLNNELEKKADDKRIENLNGTQDNSVGNSSIGNYGEETLETKVSLDRSLDIISISGYNGAYMEDGSDQDAENVMQIVVKNNGSLWLQYAEVSLTTNDMAAEFTFSSLKPGEQMVVLEKNRLKYQEIQLDEVEVSIDTIVYFEEAPTLCSDVIEISKLDGAINVKNISDTDINGQVAVYYKTVENGVYQGGITYRVLIKDGLKAGEIRQIMTNHFSLEKSEIVFVTYIP